MTPQDLYDRFRADVMDVAEPYLWSVDEVWGYADDAYSMFVRLIGGIADSSSALTVVPVVSGEERAAISPLILKVRGARVSSSNRPLRVLNLEDEQDTSQLYGAQSAGLRAMVIGEEEGSVRWTGVPLENDAVRIVVYRLPLARINEDAADDALGEIHYRHHPHLLLWMKHLAYGKQDAETFNRGKAAEFEQAFNTYCLRAKAEAARQRHKPRAVVYGGL